MSTITSRIKAPSRIEQGYDNYQEIHATLKRLELRDCWRYGWDSPEPVLENTQTSVNWHWRDPDLERSYFEGVSITIH